MSNTVTDKSRRYFGTDGVRDIANNGVMTPEFALKLGRAYVSFLMQKGIKRPEIAVGRDTRFSGPMLEDALCSGIMSAGANICKLGVIPTPGVSYVVAKNEFNGGAVISASHNPAEYNGIKFLDDNGFKLSDGDEIEIESHLDTDRASRPVSNNLGVSRFDVKYFYDYQTTLKQIISGIKDKNYPIAVDAANGAASALIGPIFDCWNADVTLCGNMPNGMNINNGVGVTHMDFICNAVVKNGARVGIAYDGDTDRVLMCDESGRVLDGDIMLWVIGRWLAKKNTLGAGVVATVMSNMELEDVLAADGIKVFRCGVGDRYVLDTMRTQNCRLGGEQSGHIIALNYANTGDGLYSGALFLTAVSELNEDISTLYDRFDKYPQILRNVQVKNKDYIMQSTEIKNAAHEAERMLWGKGRTLLRPSGTEPLIRIFVESRDSKLMNDAADMLEEKIKTTILEG